MIFLLEDTLERDLLWERYSQLLVTLPALRKHQDNGESGKVIESGNHEQLIDTICMVSPLSVEEKQKLLETKKVDEKLFILDEILNFNLESESEVKTIQ